MDFSPPLVSTITATAQLGCAVNIISTAKYTQVDDAIVGVKLAYAGGHSLILKGSCKLGVKKTGRRGFLNQITFLLIVPSGALVHCKIFHNGSLQITGGRTVSQTLEAWKTVRRILQRSKGCQSICLKQALGLLKSHDGLVFSADGTIIGWYCEERGVIFVDGYVVVESFEGHDILVSSTYKNNVKELRTLDGVLFGYKSLVFNDDQRAAKYKRHVDVEYGRAYLGSKIVGKEAVNLLADHEELLSNARRGRAAVSLSGRLLHCYSSLEGDAVNEPCEEGLSIHMINCYFQAPIRVCREKLHEQFLSEGYYSRFETCVNPGVNLRFYHNEGGVAKTGICPCANKGLTCSCRLISLRCFNSGKIIATGMKSSEQITVVYDFIRNFFGVNRVAIESAP